MKEDKLKKTVFVAHPRTQHSQQMAWALHECGILQAFWSGVPVISSDEKLPFWMPSFYLKKIKRVQIPKILRRSPFIFQVLWRLDDIFPKKWFGPDYSYYIFHLFDWWVSINIKKLKPDVVVAYEDSAYHTFRAAKKIGAKCILDAPSFHRLVGERLVNRAKTRYSAEIERRKDAEVEMADLVLTCSPLAASTYINSGVPEYKVRPVLLGATFPEGIESWKEHEEPLRFVFAGVLSYRKSIDIILDAFMSLHNEGCDYQLSFIGGEGEVGWVEKIKSCPKAKYYPSTSQTELYQFLSKADCLLLPSRFDSFGMVVAEAMACGTPVIVSTATGAKAMIEKYPRSGWIVDATHESLYACLRERIKNREEIFSARRYALEASREFTWDSYRKRVGVLVKSWINK